MPYEKILELVETRQLDITTINLAEVTGDFIKHIKTLDKRRIEPDLLADFVAIAAKLILIKSKALLPSLELTDEEESDIKELENRLKLYQKYKTCSENIKWLWQNQSASYSRSYLANKTAVFTPPTQITSNHLLTALQTIAIEFQKISPDNKKVVIKIISLEAKIKELLQKFNSLARHKFSHLVSNRSRGEVVATFLAMLHLLKDKSIKVEQEDFFGEIYVEKT